MCQTIKNVVLHNFRFSRYHSNSVTMKCNGKCTTVFDELLLRAAQHVHNNIYAMVHSYIVLSSQ